MLNVIFIVFKFKESNELFELQFHIVQTKRSSNDVTVFRLLCHNFVSSFCLFFSGTSEFGLNERLEWNSYMLSVILITE